MSTPASGIEQININNVLSDRFLDYAMSVNISRSIPDVRDGLKPVHRRILFAMHELGLKPTGKYVKSARVVGDVIGKYHPHGDSSVYDAMVRMAQPFSMSEPLIDGHGNFGSMDNDPPAAMRYTEAKPKRLAMELLENLRPEVVKYGDNYDGSFQEPSVLPALFPNLLVNGSEGIGVGMATKMAPHNLKEVISAVIAQIDDPAITVDELMEHIQGPDFPTGAVINGTEGFSEAYKTGRGTVRIRAKAEIVEGPKLTQIRITEIPYQVVKENLVEKIMQIQLDWEEYEQERTKKSSKAKPKGMDFIHRGQIRDETDRADLATNSVKIIIDLKKGVNPHTVLNYLYKHTPLETTFSILNLALVPKRVGEVVVRMRPKVLNLKEIIHEYILHQKEVTINQKRHELTELKKDMRKLDALIKALDKLDETIELIREAKTNEEAVKGLIDLLSIEEDQAESILAVRLRTLSGFSQDEKRKEHITLAEKIKEIEEILADEKKILAIIKEYLTKTMNNYGRDRRTEIMENFEAIDIEATIPNDDVVITITHNGFVKRTLDSTYRTQRRNGRGVNGMGMYEDDFIEHLQIAKNHDHLLFFTNLGRVYELKAYQIPENVARSRGVSIKSVLNFEPEENIQAVLSVRKFSDEQTVLFSTKNGVVKKSLLSAYNNIRKNGIMAIKLDEGDRVIGVALTNGERNITLVTKKGLSITFDEAQVNTVGRVSRGVKGIDLASEDEIVSVAIHEEEADLFVATNEGFGKRTPLSEFRVQNRGGKGVICMKLTDKNGQVVNTEVVQITDTMMLITKHATLMKLKSKEISQFNRNTQGTRIINLREGDELQAIARIVDVDDDEFENVEIENN